MKEIIKNQTTYWIFLIFLNYRGSWKQFIFLQAPRRNFYHTQFNLKVEFLTENVLLLARSPFDERWLIILHKATWPSSSNWEILTRKVFSFSLHLWKRTFCIIWVWWQNNGEISNRLRTLIEIFVKWDVKIIVGYNNYSWYKFGKSWNLLRISIS